MLRHWLQPRPPFRLVVHSLCCGARRRAAASTVTTCMAVLAPALSLAAPALSYIPRCTQSLSTTSFFLGLSAAAFYLAVLRATHDTWRHVRICRPSRHQQHVRLRRGRGRGECGRRLLRQWLRRRHRVLHLSTLRLLHRMLHR